MHRSSRPPKLAQMPAGPVPPKGSSKRQAQERRQARLAAELRANLLKRKAQARGRTLREGSGSVHQQDGQTHEPDAREAANADKRSTRAEVA